MNLLRKLSFSLVFVLAALSLRAQAVIDLSAYIDDETAAQLGDNNAAALKNKISKIITRNGMADAAGLLWPDPVSAHSRGQHRRRYVAGRLGAASAIFHQHHKGIGVFRLPDEAGKPGMGLLVRTHLGGARLGPHIQVAEPAAAIVGRHIIGHHV